MLHRRVCDGQDHHHGTVGSTDSHADGADKSTDWLPHRVPDVSNVGTERADRCSQRGAGSISDITDRRADLTDGRSDIARRNVRPDWRPHKYPDLGTNDYCYEYPDLGSDLGQ